MDPADFKSEVVSMLATGLLGQRVQDLGVRVRSLHMRRGVPNPLALVRLARWLQQDPPDVIQTWQHHADLIGGLAASLAGNIPVAWGIHHTDLDPQFEKRSAIWTAMACARLSRQLPTQIVCCSKASIKSHIQMGYPADKMVFIPNGFDLEAFRPDSNARRSVRQEIRIPDAAPLIGLVARFHPEKGHRNFIEAAARLLAQVPECHFLLCGEDITWGNAELVDWIEVLGIRRRCHLLGERTDIPRLTAAFDVATVAASGEAFPMVIGEAMACGIPCVATDVGDSAIIVGDTGVIVPPRDPQALADGWRRLLTDISQEERMRLGLAARRRITENFSLAEIVAKYEGVYASLLT